MFIHSKAFWYASMQDGKQTMGMLKQFLNHLDSK